MPSWMSRAIRLRSSRLANWRSVPKSRPAWRVGAMRRVTSRATWRSASVNGLPSGRSATRTVVEPLPRAKGTTRARRRPTSSLKVTSVGTQLEGLVRSRSATCSAMCHGRAGRAAQRDGHEVLGVLGDEHGTARRGHLGRRAGRAPGTRWPARRGRSTSARRGPAGAGSARWPRARQGRRPAVLLVGQPPVPGAEHAQGDGRAEPRDQLDCRCRSSGRAARRTAGTQRTRRHRSAGSRTGRTSSRRGRPG